MELVPGGDLLQNANLAGGKGGAVLCACLKASNKSYGMIYHYCVPWLSHVGFIPLMYGRRPV